MFGDRQLSALQSQNDRLKRKENFAKTNRNRKSTGAPSEIQPVSFYATRTSVPKDYLADPVPTPPRERSGEALADWYKDRSSTAPKTLTLFDDDEPIAAKPETKLELPVAKSAPVVKAPVVKAPEVKAPELPPKPAPTGDAEFRFVSAEKEESNNAAGQPIFEAPPMDKSGSRVASRRPAVADGWLQFKNRASGARPRTLIDTGAAPIATRIDSQPANPLRGGGSDQPNAVSPAAWTSDRVESPIRMPIRSNPLRP
jgi:hypothetical protein